MFKPTFSTIILGSCQPLEINISVKLFCDVPEPKCQTHHTPHKKNKKHQTTQVPQVCGNYPAKKDRSQASSKLFSGGWVSMHLQNANNRKYIQLTQKLYNGSTDHHEIIWNDMKWYYFRVSCVSLCHMPAQENLSYKIIIHHVQNLFEGPGTTQR